MAVFNRAPIVILLFFFVFLTIFYYWSYIAITFYNWWHIAIIKNLFYILNPIPLLFAIVLFLFLYEKINYQSTFLVFLGNYSYEIYLLHLPFMNKYDFFLYREPLYFFFFVYLSLLIVISITLAKLSSSVLKTYNSLLRYKK